MKTKINYILTVGLLLPLFFLSTGIRAQQEIPDNIKDHISKGIDAFSAAKTPEDIETALKEFNEAEKTAPDFADVHYYLGKTYSLLQGNAGRARNELKKYLELYPDAPEKEEVNAEIKRLEKVIEEKRTSIVSGLELIKLHDGIYVKKKLPLKTASSRITTREPALSLQPGDKLVSVGDIGVDNLSIDEVLSLIYKDPSMRLVHIKVVRGGSEFNAMLEKKTSTSIDNVTYLGEEDLRNVVEESTIPVIAIFWKTDDPECTKYVHDLATEAYKTKGTIAYYLVNVDENVIISAEYNVTEIPTILFFKGGKLIGKITGYNPELFKEKADSIDTINKPFGL